MDHFREAMMDCDLEDLGFEVDVFTWWNNQHMVEGVCEGTTRPGSGKFGVEDKVSFVPCSER
jgi:hypothetical protein